MKINEITIQFKMTAGELDALAEVYVQKEMAKTGLPFSQYLSDPNCYIQLMRRNPESRALPPKEGATF